MTRATVALVLRTANEYIANKVAYEVYKTDSGKTDYAFDRLVCKSRSAFDEALAAALTAAPSLQPLQTAVANVLNGVPIGMLNGAQSFVSVETRLMRELGAALNASRK